MRTKTDIYTENNIVSEIESGTYDEVLCELYGDVKAARVRYAQAAMRFEKLFSKSPDSFFSAPGRTEICGNHLDHQKGCVIAAAIDLDIIAAVSPREDLLVHIISEGNGEVNLSLADLDAAPEEIGTTAALVRGVASGLKNGALTDKDIELRGFDAYITSDIPSGSGLSSSAAFEILIGKIFTAIASERTENLAGGNGSGCDVNDSFINNYEPGMIKNHVVLARIGQYAENDYFGKPSGLMDQMACSVGGVIYIDFENEAEPKVTSLEADLPGMGLSLCICNTGGSHADLTDDYAAVRSEMNQVAGIFGKDVLREVPQSEFLNNLGKLKGQVSDRAILRGLHYYGESARTLKAKDALEERDTEAFLDCIRESGRSSANLLQNIYSPAHPEEQRISLAIALSEYFFCCRVQGNCAVRVHGGGFAGTIQAFMPEAVASEYKSYMDSFFGKEAVKILRIRHLGAVKVI